MTERAAHADAARTDDVRGVEVCALERLLVVDKPAGVSAEQLADARALKLVHRIDKATSGLLVLARDARTVQRMQRALRDGQVERRYLLVAHGRVADGALHSTLVRDRGDGLRGSGAGGKHAALTLRCLGTTPDGAASLCEATLVTGRTHQIRIQLSEAGHPLVGERVYVRDHRAAGRVELEAPRLLLHAWRLAFVDPDSKRAVVVTCAAPAGFLTAVPGLPAAP